MRAMSEQSRSSFGLRWTEEEERQLREEIIAARKYEQELLQTEARIIEEEQKRLLLEGGKQFISEDDQQRKLELERQAAEHFRLMTQQAQEYEKQRLAKATEQLIAANKVQLKNEKIAFEAAERAREEEERKMIEDHEKMMLQMEARKAQIQQAKMIAAEKRLVRRLDEYKLPGEKQVDSSSLKKIKNSPTSKSVPTSPREIDTQQQIQQRLQQEQERLEKQLQDQQQQLQQAINEYNEIRSQREEQNRKEGDAAGMEKSPVVDEDHNNTNINNNINNKDNNNDNNGGNNNQNEDEDDENSFDLVSLHKSLSKVGSSLQQQPSSPRNRKVVLLMTVEIGDGRVDTLRIHDDDILSEVATQFCKKHGLDESIIEPLTEHIQATVDVVATKNNTSAHNTSRHSSGSKRPGSSLGTDKEGDRLAHLTRAGSLRRQSPTFKKQQLFNKGVVPSLDSIRGPTPSIDPNSRKLAERSRLISSFSHHGNKNDVFNRLFEQSQLKRKQLEESSIIKEERERQTLLDKVPMSKASKKILRERGMYNSMGEFKNYGERLYAEAKRRHEERLRQEMERARMEEENLDPEATFRPEISEMAKRLERDRTATVWDRLGEMAVQKHLQHQQDMEANLVKECTFRPRINNTSIVSSSSSSSHNQSTNGSAASHKPAEDDGAAGEATAPESSLPRYEQLFLDAERRRLRAEEFQRLCPKEITFHPNIGNNRYRPKADADMEEFINRLVYSKRETERQLEELRRQRNQNIDPETGQEFFKPVIRKAPQNMLCNHHNDSLFTTRNEFYQIRQQLQEQQMKALQEMANMPKVSEKSRRLIEKALHKNLKEIFDYLDEDQDGFIQPRHFDIHKFEPTELAKELQAVFQKFEIPNQHISFDQFYKAVLDRLNKSKNQGPKLTVLHSFKLRRITGSDAHNYGADFNFHPKVNEHSKRLAQNKGRGEAPIYEVLRKEGELIERKIKAMVNEKLNEEARECTFKPKVDETTAMIRRDDEPEDPKLKIENLTKRLTAPPKRKPQVEYIPYEEQIMKECTFVPNLQMTLRKSTNSSRGGGDSLNSTLSRSTQQQQHRHSNNNNNSTTTNNNNNNEQQQQSWHNLSNFMAQQQQQQQYTRFTLSDLLDNTSAVLALEHDEVFGGDDLNGGAGDELVVSDLAE